MVSVVVVGSDVVEFEGEETVSVVVCKSEVVVKFTIEVEVDEFSIIVVEFSIIVVVVVVAFSVVEFCASTKTTNNKKKNTENKETRVFIFFLFCLK